jgi:hypothetical protein
MTAFPAKDDLVAQTAAVMEQHEQWWREPEAQASMTHCPECDRDGPLSVFPNQATSKENTL